MIISRKWAGHECLAKIMQYGKKSVDASDVNAVYMSEIDMVKRVSAVLAEVGSKTPLSIFDNIFMRQYLKMLDPKYPPPYRLEHVRIMEVLMDATMMEFVRVAKIGVYCMTLMFLFHILLCIQYLHYYINPTFIIILTLFSLCQAKQTP